VSDRERDREKFGFGKSQSSVNVEQIDESGQRDKEQRPNSGKYTVAAAALSVRGATGPNVKDKVTLIGARAAWSLNDWSLMGSFMADLQQDNSDTCLMRAVLAVHDGDYATSSMYIEEVRKRQYQQLSGLLAESYSRAYVPLVMLQHCSELEEITDYQIFLKASLTDAMGSKDGTGTTAGGAVPDPHRMRVNTPDRLTAEALGAAPPAPSDGGDLQSARELAAQHEASRRKTVLVKKWRRRIKGCRCDGRAAINVWKNIMNIRRIILHEKEDIDTWLEFATMCRHGGNVALAERILNTMSSEIFGRNMADVARTPPRALSSQTLSSLGHLPKSPSSSNLGTFGPTLMKHPLMSIAMERKICLAVLRQRWSVGQRNEALKELENLINTIDEPTGTGGGLPKSNSGADMSAGMGTRRPSFQQLSQDSGASSGSFFPSPREEDNRIHLECLLKLGRWKLDSIEPGQLVTPAQRKEVLDLYQRAIAVNNKSYRAWHEWAMSNYRAIEETQGKVFGRRSFTTKATPQSMFGPVRSTSINPTATSTLLSSAFPIIHEPHAQTHASRNLSAEASIVLEEGTAEAGLGPSTGGAGARGVTGTASRGNIPEKVTRFAVAAAKGFLRAIALGTKRWASSVMQDMLCVLNVWFRHGRIPSVHTTLDAGLSTVHLDNWLGVLPQLIARIDHSEEKARKLLHNLLVRLGERHTQALVYPLWVALKSPKLERAQAAEALTESLRQHSSRLVDQATLVSQELIRVAILWEELWYEAMEQASKYYFGNGNIQAMLDTLLPQHQV